MFIMADKQILIDLDDPRAGMMAEILGNKSCKQILGILADGEMSESEIASNLKIPLNTVDYNVKKLIDAGLIEETKGFLWSSRGKRILKYKVARKKIVISPKTSFKGLIPAVLISGFGAILIRYWTVSKSVIANSMSKAGEIASDRTADLVSSSSASAPAVGASGVSEKGAELVSNMANIGSPAIWFMFGALVALLIFLVWNWRKVW